jgi:hypothetical protein
MWLAWRPFRNVLSDRRLMIAAAAAFPPFWYLVLHGQSSLVLLLGFTLGWLALEHRRPFWAGMAFGLLLLKPQFALVLAPLVLICGEWSMLAGAVVSIGLQATAVVIVLGQSVLWDYAALVARFPQMREAIQSRPEQMHSIATVANSQLGGWGMAVWALLSVLVIARTIQVWRSDAPLALRAGTLVLASELVNPHVFVYDVVVLAPALLWLAAWAYGGSRSGRMPSVFTPVVYGLYVSLLIPSALFLPVQVSVFLLCGLFAVVSTDVLSLQNPIIEKPPVISSAS